MGGWWVVCEGHNYMIPNIKTFFDKKVIFLVLMSMKHPSSFLNICTFKMKKYNLKPFESLRMAPKICTIKNLGSSRYYRREKKLKACQERLHLVSGSFIKVFYKMDTCPRQPLLSGPKWSL